MDDEYAELEGQEEIAGKLGVVVDRIESFTDSDRVVRSLREGKVVFAKIGQFKTTNVDELKRTLLKIKSVCKAIDGEIVAVGQQDWVIIAPPSCQIVR
jgi:SepF-like predicted cell division protein (DUF552 family)